MWIVTQDGFFSVTAYDPRIGGERGDAEDLIVIRARVLADLERIEKWIGSDVLSTPTSDYPFRIITPRESWTEYLSHATSQIDYFNFKARVNSRLGTQRHDVLLAVWTALRRLRPKS